MSHKGILLLLSALVVSGVTGSGATNLDQECSKPTEIECDDSRASQTQTGYYYDINEQECKEFSGCYDTTAYQQGHLFEYEYECKKKCYCTALINLGEQCSNADFRKYYDSEAKECKKLRKCKINGKKFEKMESCQHQCSCYEDVIAETNGTFTSQNYPENYPKDMDCTWNITAPAGMRVVLVFTDFHVRVGDFPKYPHCDKQNGDFVEVTDPNNGISTVICGSHKDDSVQLPLILTSSSADGLTVRLVTQHANPAKGFSASYVVFDPNCE